MIFKRYLCTDEGSTYESYGAPIMQENIDGNYVHIKDFEKLKAALETIAKEDYRGNRPFGITIARKALGLE